MTLTTPRGVKLYLDCEDAFALLSRLPAEKRFAVLELSQTLWRLPGFVSFLVSIAVALYGNVYYTALIVPSSALCEWLLVRNGLITNKVFAPLCLVTRVYSVLTGFGIFLVLCLALFYVKLGWIGAVAYLLANAIRISIDSKCNERYLTRMIASLGEGQSLLTGYFEGLCFILAFQKFANEYGVDGTPVVQVGESELENSIVALQEFKRDHPEVFRHFGKGEGLRLARAITKC